MQKKEIEKRVRQLWREKRPQQPTDEDMFVFFSKLQNQNGELTIFGGRRGMNSDPWQTIHCWLLDEERKLGKQV